MYVHIDVIKYVTHHSFSAPALHMKSLWLQQLTDCGGGLINVQDLGCHGMKFLITCSCQTIVKIAVKEFLE